MSESSPSYQDGEVVWVKWGNVWWPGEVWNDSRVPDDILTSLRKPVIAFVKFFQEDSFEFVRSPNNICPYNSEKKMDYIRKGMDKYRSNNKIMTNFPADVIKAEQLTNGNVNILDILETPTKSKGIVSISAPDTMRKSAEISAATTQSSVGGSKKSIGSYNSSVKVQNTTSPAPKSSDKKLTCTMCNFATGRMNLLMMHIKNHSHTILSRVNSPSSSLEIRRSVIPKVSSRSKEYDDGIAEDVRKIKESMKETAKITPLSTTIKKTKTPSSSATAKSTPKLKQSRQRKDRYPANKDIKDQNEKTISVKKLQEEETETDSKSKIANTSELKNELLADWLDEEDIKVEEAKSVEKEPVLNKAVTASGEKSEESPIKTIEKPSGEAARSIRNIPKKQRVSEIYIQPEKVEIPDSVIGDTGKIKLKALKDEKVKEELLSTFVTEINKKSQQKASKRKYAILDSSTEPEKKKMSEENDDKILMATAELLNETEVPIVSNVQSSSTFHGNDIDKRYLPPKERNKRIFRAKISPEKVSLTPSIKPMQKSDKTNNEKDKISTEYDIKIEMKNVSITGPVEGTTLIEDARQLPMANCKNERQELMLPHKKKQSSRFLTTEKLSSVCESPKAVIIEQITSQEPVTTTTSVSLKLKRNQKSTDSQNNIDMQEGIEKSDDDKNAITSTHIGDNKITESVKCLTSNISETSVKSFQCDSTTVSTSTSKESSVRGQKRHHQKDSPSEKNIYEFQPESKKVHKLETPKTIIACSSETICITSKGTLAVARRDSIKTTVANSVVVTSQVIITEATKQPIASSQSLASHMISSSSSPKQQSISSAVTNPSVSTQQILKNALKIPKENVVEMKKQGLVTIENNKTKLTPKGRQKFIEFQNEKNSLSTTSPTLSHTTSTLSHSTSTLSHTTSSLSTISISSNEDICCKDNEKLVDRVLAESQSEEKTKLVNIKSEEAQNSNSVNNDEINEKKDVEIKNTIEIDDKNPKEDSKSSPTEKLNKDEIESKVQPVNVEESKKGEEEKEIIEINTNVETLNDKNLQITEIDETKVISKDDSCNNKDETIVVSENIEKNTSTNKSEDDSEINLDSSYLDESKSQESTPKSKCTDGDEIFSEKLVVENGKNEMEESLKEESELSQDSGSTGLIALQAETFGGPPNCFYLCRQVEDRFVPVDDQILVLNSQNALVPYESVISDLGLAANETVQENLSAYSQLSPNSNIIINTPNGQKIELSHHTILALHEQADENGIASIELAGESLELNINVILEAIAAQQDVQESNEPLIPGAVLLESTDGPLIIDSEIPIDIHHPSVATQVSETLSKPIMSTTVAPEIAINSTKPTISENTTRILNIEDSLATIGVTTQRDVPKSLELPITVTNPKIAETVNHRKLAASFGTDIVADFTVQPTTDNGSDD